MGVNSCLLHLLHLIFIIICLPKSLSDQHLAQAFFDSVKCCENEEVFQRILMWQTNKPRIKKENNEAFFASKQTFFSYSFVTKL